jgi:beta-galactosidase/beta-glucuronidase
MRVTLAALLAICLGPAPGVGLTLTSAADWQPARGPLETRWAREVRPDRVHPEYPRPQLVRDEWLNLNGVWQLAFPEVVEKPPLGQTLPEKILVPFPVESALSGVMRHADRLWYRRTFRVRAAWMNASRRVLLHFGAVDWEARVWVNGKELRSHRGGYDGFSLDVTDALLPEGDQELIVGVWDPTSDGTQPRGKQVLKPGGIYYTPTTGIWQTVWIEPVPTSSIQALKIVPDVDAAKVRVTVAVARETAGLTARVMVLDGAAAVALAEGKAGQEIALPIDVPKL